MDACIWTALYIINPNLKDRIVSIFTYLRLIFKDEPKTFIESLRKVIEKRHKFAKDLLGSTASRICYIDLEKSVDDVLQRFISDVISKPLQTAQKDNVTELFNLKIKIRDLVRKHTHYNETISFDEEEFIKELKEIENSFIKLEQYLK
jgi:hypothetical protein